MNNILIKTINLPEWLVEKHFKNEDLVSIEDLIAKIEDLDSDLERIQEEFQNFKKDVKDNYKYIDQREAIGYNENW